MKKENKYKWENGQVIDQKTGEIYIHEQHAYWNYRHKMKENKELIILSGFMGFAIGVLCMMFLNETPGELCYDIIENIEHSICEDCWGNVFDYGEKYEEIQNYETWEY
mgnify:FL=1